MRKIKINLKKIEKKDIEDIVSVFLKGGIVVYPSDTVYGIGCIATDKKAVDRVRKLKKRDYKKPFLFLVKSFCMAKKYAKVNKKQDEYLRTIWPARTNSAKIHQEAKKSPKTVILKSRGVLPNNVENEDASIALRLPKNDFLSTILKKLDLPIISTSLNISGQQTIGNLDHLDKIFEENKIDLVVDGGPISRQKSSEIIDIRDINNIIKIR